MVETPGGRLRALAVDGTLQVPGAPNALSAKLIEQIGFPAIYLSGAALSAGVLGLPDIGLLTLPELTQQAKYLVNATTCPVIVDADTGFGETVNVERTVAELEGVGVAAIQLEDQVLPKRCGHLAGKELVATETMCEKLRAAVAARCCEDTILIARTDARGVTSLADAVERAQAYLAAGADWVFPEALRSEDEFASFREQVTAPLVANMTEFGKSPLLPFATFQQLGYAAVLYPVTLLRLAMKAAEAALVTIAEAGTQSDLLDLMQTRQELYDLLEYEVLEEHNLARSNGPASEEQTDE